MKLVIKDQEGNEVGFDRISLIPGGIEIILDAERIRVPGSDEVEIPDILAHGVHATPEQVAASPKTLVEKVAEMPKVEQHTQKAEAFLAEIPELPQVAESIFSEGTGGKPRSVVKEVAQGIDELAAERLAEVDKDGSPWDARIHSSSKKKGAKGVWNKRKNLPEGLYDQIKAELLSGAPQPESQAISTDRPTPKAPPVPPVAAGKQAAPPVPPVPGNVESAAKNVPAAEAGEGAVPPPPPPVPANNVIGDSNDSDLDNIMSKWGTGN